MKNANFLKRILAMVLCAVMVMSILVSCSLTLPDDSSDSSTESGGEDSSTETPDVPDEPGAVKVVISSTISEIKGDETIQMTVAVSNTDNTAVTWSTSDPSILTVTADGLVSIAENANFTVDKLVTIIATSVADSTKTGKKTLIVRAPTREGAVGDLTSDMLKALGNESITVNGLVVDYYIDYLQQENSATHYYETLVEMAPGAWKGVWYAQGSPDTAVTTQYRRGTTTNLKDAYGNVGTAIEKLYIGKNNTMVAKPEKDYQSIPAVWEAQHLWNHLANLDITKFTYDVEHERYVYAVDSENVDDLYLMTYFAISLTPMLTTSDIIANFYFEVKDGAITKMVAETQKDIVTDSDGNAEQCAYSMMTFTFTKVGTTVVSDPAPFEAPEHADKLAAAIEKMKNARNYTFRVKDVTLSSVSASDDDYSMESMPKAKMSLLATDATRAKYNNYTSSTGTVGCIGFVTVDAIVFAYTAKYTSSLDDKLYHTEYNGYKDNGDGTYDEFNGSTNGILYGTKYVTGNIFDRMPDFDFSANVFELSDSVTRNGVTYYTFTLRETAITRDVAMSMSAYKYNTSADASIERILKIVVDSNGNLISTEFPYNISDNYIGYCTTTYEKFDETTLREGAFDDYVPREHKTTWGQYDVKYYHPDHSTISTPVDVKADVLFKTLYGEADAALLPTAETFMNIFGDNLNGPFFDWDEMQDAAGNPFYRESLGITTVSGEYDENGKITNYDEIIAALDQALTALGFQKSTTNTDTSGGESGRSNRYVTYTNGGVQIVIENNFTRYFWITFYKTGEWTLKKSDAGTGKG